MINGSAYHTLPSYSYFNGLLDIDNGDDGSLDEPVTLSAVKDFARITGTSQDTLVTALITTARQMCEQYVGLNLIKRAITVVINNPLGNMFLPYGPVSLPVTSIKDCEGVAITDYTISGTVYPQLLEPRQERITISYDAGFETLPEQFKTAIMEQVAFLYRNRGDEEQRSRTGQVVELGLSSMAKTILKPLKR